MMDNELMRDPYVGFGPRPSPGNCSTGFTNETKKNLNHSYQNRKDGVIKKKVNKIGGGGLREFSLRVCKMVQNKGRTTHSEVADEIVAEFAALGSNSSVSLDESNVKNVRRRVYDSLNVLMAIDIITKVGKEIQWKGLPNSNTMDMEEIKVAHSKLISAIGKKAAYLKDIEDQVADLQNLILRNRELLKPGRVHQGFSLPFLLVQTKPHATVEIEISEDRQLVHLDFNSTPFSVHDDADILRFMHDVHLLQSERISQSS